MPPGGGSGQAVSGTSRGVAGAGRTRDQPYSDRHVHIERETREEKRGMWVHAHNFDSRATGTGSGERGRGFRAACILVHCARRSTLDAAAITIPR